MSGRRVDWSNHATALLEFMLQKSEDNVAFFRKSLDTHEQILEGLREELEKRKNEHL